MNAKIRSYIFIAALICADIWNILCLTQVLSFDRWRISFAISGIGILTMLIPQFYRSVIKKDASEPETTPSAAAVDKSLFGIMIGAVSVLAITWIACIVYPL